MRFLWRRQNRGPSQEAAQGRFQIENRDAATLERKVVRVVVDVEYEVN
jgi:hypothetical protein